MLFHTMWEFHPSNSEEAIQRNLAFFSDWKPPDGFEFKGFWGFADGSGGVAIVETDSAATLARATAPFTPWLRFSDQPDPSDRRVVGNRRRSRGGARFVRRLAAAPCVGARTSGATGNVRRVSVPGHTTRRRLRLRRAAPPAGGAASRRRGPRARAASPRRRTARRRGRPSRAQVPASGARARRAAGTARRSAWPDGRAEPRAGRMSNAWSLPPGWPDRVAAASGDATNGVAGLPQRRCRSAAQRIPPRSKWARKKFSLPAVAIAAEALISSASAVAATSCASR